MEYFSELDKQEKNKRFWKTTKYFVWTFPFILILAYYFVGIKFGILSFFWYLVVNYIVYKIENHFIAKKIRGFAEMDLLILHLVYYQRVVIFLLLLVPPIYLLVK